MAVSNTDPNNSALKRPRSGAKAPEYRRQQREIKLKAKAEAEGQTYTKHERTAQRTAEIIKKDVDEKEIRQRANTKNDLEGIMTARFGTLRDMSELTSQQELLLARGKSWMVRRLWQ